MVTLYVEGGGDANSLKTACRAGFTEFITKAGIKKRPRVVACGSRRDAYDSFCTAIAQGDDALLLVDSEAAVAAQHQAGGPERWSPWRHLLQRDNWSKPVTAQEADCHLMTQVMETWFVADPATLAAFFGQGFNDKALPAAANQVESIAKQAVYSALQQATKQCKTKSAYGKGEHSFKLLAKVVPAAVMDASPWAKRFVDELKKKMDT